MLTLGQIRDTLARLQRQYADIARTDYFDCPEGTLVGAKLARIAQAITSGTAPDPDVQPAAVAAYKDGHWVTRPQPHVDRLACAWLIRRYINPDSVIRYSLQAELREVAFDMNEAEFGHSGNFCTFETVVCAFGLDAPGLSTMAEIVLEIDLRDERYMHPEIPGIDAMLKGWSLLDLSDAERELRGIALFDGPYKSLAAHARLQSS